MRARHFEPVIGRFMQVDPLGLAGSISYYSYANNDPNAWIDPAGTNASCLAAVLKWLYGDPNSWGTNGGPGGYVLQKAYDMTHDPYALGYNGGDPEDYVLASIGLLPFDTTPVTDFTRGDRCRVERKFFKTASSRAV